MSEANETKPTFDQILQDYEERRRRRVDAIAEDLCGGAKGLDVMKRDLAKLLGRKYP